jgi:Cu-processing system ATP-binding protein
MTTARALRDLGEHPVWIRMEGLRKRYGRRPVLRDVDVCFRPGRVTALLGPNGAGKTTLLKMLLGLVRPDEGTIRIGEQVVGADPDYRSEIGYMPQLPRFPENLTGRELAAMLDDVRGFPGRPDDRLIREFDLEAELDKPFRSLSGGNRQKLNAALAFRYDAAVLVLDEPTAGLDPLAARVLKERVRAERDAGRTVVLTSHDLGQLEALADDVVFLLDGEVRFEGEFPELYERTGEETLEAALASLLRAGRPAGSDSTSEGVA